MNKRSPSPSPTLWFQDEARDESGRDNSDKHSQEQAEKESRQNEGFYPWMVVVRHPQRRRSSVLMSQGRLKYLFLILPGHWVPNFTSSIADMSKVVIYFIVYSIYLLPIFLFFCPDAAVFVLFA